MNWHSTSLNSFLSFVVKYCTFAAQSFSQIYLAKFDDIQKYESRNSFGDFKK